jgi:putative endonuclease
MPPVPAPHTLGHAAEALAAAELCRRGYAVLATRYRSRFGEIDIVAKKDGLVVFVEVKARRTGRAGTAAEGLSPRKRRRIAAMALDYLAWHGLHEARCRFDVVAIDRFGSDRQTLAVIEDAFQIDR